MSAEAGGLIWGLLLPPPPSVFLPAHSKSASREGEEVADARRHAPLGPQILGGPREGLWNVAVLRGNKSAAGFYEGDISAATQLSIRSPICLVNKRSSCYFPPTQTSHRRHAPEKVQEGGFTYGDAVTTSGWSGISSGLIGANSWSFHSPGGKRRLGRRRIVTAGPPQKKGTLGSNV